MRRAIQALEEAVAAVVGAVEQMREIVVALAADAVAVGGGEDAPSGLVGEDERGAALLQAKVLRRAVEDLAVAGAGD